jgi:hypothetical protein
LAFGDPARGADGLQHRLDRQRAVPPDLGGDLPSPLESLAVGHHVADQPELLGFGRGDVLAGEQYLRRRSVGDLAGQANR